MIFLTSGSGQKASRPSLRSTCNVGLNNNGVPYTWVIKQWLGSKNQHPFIFIGFKGSLISLNRD